LEGRKAEQAGKLGKEGRKEGRRGRIAQGEMAHLSMMKHDAEHGYSSLR